MKETLEKILEEYLKVFPEEKERQNEYKKYLKSAKGDEVADWNNFNGHTVATGFIYNKNRKRTREFVTCKNIAPLSKIVALDENIDKSTVKVYFFYWIMKTPRYTWGSKGF